MTIFRRSFLEILLRSHFMKILDENLQKKQQSMYRQVTLIGEIQSDTGFVISIKSLPCSMDLGVRIAINISK